MSRSLLDNLDVFYGELTPARATVYARLEGLENTEGLLLTGSVRGPRCFYSKTLPATFRLQDAGPGPSLLAKSLVPDPSYWSPETPHLYDVTVELRKGVDVIASEVRQIGLKPLGISGRLFTWEGKPWVLRGIHWQVPPGGWFRDAQKQLDWFAWRDTRSVFVTTCSQDFSEEKLQEASAVGVVAMPCVVSSDEALRAEMRRLAKHPAVCFVVTEVDKQTGLNLSRIAPNILMGQLVRRHLTGQRIERPITPSRTPQYDWARFAIAAFDDAGDSAMSPAEFAVMTSNWELPIIARSSSSHTKRETENPSVLRRECDQLQSTLAVAGQYAGYLV
jgi:hypothetical protein